MDGIVVIQVSSQARVLPERWKLLLQEPSAAPYEKNLVREWWQSVNIMVNFPVSYFTDLIRVWDHTFHVIPIRSYARDIKFILFRGPIEN